MVQEYISDVIDVFTKEDRVVFRLNKPFDFIAGQFISIILEFDNKKVVRSYSISSSPNNKFMEFYVKRIENGLVSNYLFNLKKGDVLKFIGPLGKFNVDLLKSKNVCLIGFGTGIAPIKSMVGFLLESDFQGDVELFYGNRFFNTLIFHENFVNLVENNGNFYYYPVLSKPDISWDEFKGHIQDNMVFLDFEMKDFFICGSDRAVDDAINFLSAKGVLKEKIYFEKF